MGHNKTLFRNSLSHTAKSEAHDSSSSFKVLTMDILKLLFELSLQVAGEKREVGFGGLLKEAPNQDGNPKNTPLALDSSTTGQRQRRTWKWKSKSCVKSKRKSAEIDITPNTNVCTSIDTASKPTDDKLCSFKNNSVCCVSTSQSSSSTSSPKHNGFSAECKEASSAVVPPTDSQNNSDPGVDCNAMSMLQKLALNALNLTAPASSVLLNNRRNSWVQLSGHQGCLAPAGPGTIWKKRSGETNESMAYKKLMKDIAKDIVPTFYKEVIFQGEHFIEMRDLLYDFNNPSVIDIKVGTRTFLESEVTNKKARNDLYQKMIKVDPNSPNEEERLQEAVTKLRYMDFRDNNSSSRSLGFRVDALKMSGTKEVTEVRNVRTRDEVLNTIAKFLRNRDSTKKQVLSRLKEIKSTFEASEFFNSHEIIGSSILIIYDDEKAGAWIIDFAKTFPLPENITTNHRTPWVLGNHEEGYLTGLENLIKVVEEVPSNKSRKIPFFGR